MAVEAQREGQVKTIKFSTDEGQCWKLYNFTEQPFFFAGLASEPGTKAMNVSVWGFRPEEDGQPMWVAVTIDFQSLITRECELQRFTLQRFYTEHAATQWWEYKFHHGVKRTTGLYRLK